MSSTVGRHRVLVVEDEPATRNMLRDLLVDHGYDVMAAEDGAVALGELDSTAERPELVLLDLRMPFIDGPTFVELLRARPESAHTPVLVVSGNVRQSLPNRVQGIRVLRKPFDVDALLEAVREMLPIGGASDDGDGTAC